MKQLKASLSFVVLMSSLSSCKTDKSEGICPDGLYPAGGGYCRNIVCPDITTANVFSDDDQSAKDILVKNKKACQVGTKTMWGNTIVPMK